MLPPDGCRSEPGCKPGGRANWPVASGEALLNGGRGDVLPRASSNVKRVASAVGEGSIAVSFVHQVLAE
jgi:hypothetical protein